MGTVSGGRQAAATNKAKYGEDFYVKLGAKGGKRGHTGGFAADRNMARAAGAIGGAISRKNGRLTLEEENEIRAMYGASLRTA